MDISEGDMTVQIISGMVTNQIQSDLFDII